jgi:hypothetical protein
MVASIKAGYELLMSGETSEVGNDLAHDILVHMLKIIDRHKNKFSAM